MKETYTQQELDEIMSRLENRNGWDFSRMKDLRQPVPWDYIEIVKKYTRPSDVVLDIGTGGGERLVELSSYFDSGVGIDIDPEMIEIARQKAGADSNLTFKVSDEKLVGLNKQFNVIINRHAPFDLSAILEHLKDGGYFITQQVGENNMQNIKEVLGQTISKSPISQSMVENAGLKCLQLNEYNVEYVVEDIESLVFWLNALDYLHSDLNENDAVSNVDTLNKILKNNVDSRGFVTNEQRYILIAQK